MSPSGRQGGQRHVARSWRLGGATWTAWCGEVVPFDVDGPGIRHSATCDECNHLYDDHEATLRRNRAWAHQEDN